jgi:hypothetical protein
MSYASDFGHDIPPDDWNGDYGRRRYRARYHYNDNRRTELCYHDIVAETDKALLFLTKDGKTWVPKSKIESIHYNLHIAYIPLWLWNKLKYFEDTPE